MQQGKIRSTKSCKFSSCTMTRGLDVDDIKFVINYDYPSNSEDYIHRIGRTGRKGNTGTSYTLFTPQNSHKAQVCPVISVISSHLSALI